MSEGLWIAVAVIAVLVVAALAVGLVRYRRSRISLPPGRDETTAVDRSGGYTASSGITFSRTEDLAPTVGEDAEVPRDAPKRTISEVHLPEPEVLAPPEPEVIEPEIIAPPEPEAAPEPGLAPRPAPAPAPAPAPPAP